MSGRPRGRPRKGTNPSTPKSTQKAPSSGSTLRGRGRGRPPVNIIRTRNVSKKRARDYDCAPDFYSDPEDSDQSEDTEMPSNSDAIDVNDLLDDEREDVIDLLSASVDDSEDDLRDELMAPWEELDECDLPFMELPRSSTDLGLPQNMLFPVLELYEFTRCYSRALQYSTSLFEDFCAALMSKENSAILSELHISLMKLCWREDEDQQIIYTEKDMNNSWNILVQLLDPMTYVEVLRQFLESDHRRFPKEVIQIVSQPDYPFVNVADRITVLNWLREKFLRTADYKNIIRNEGKIMWESTCRICGKLGDVVLCDGCEACYHQQCIPLDNLPEGTWYCSICEHNQIKGVSDCLPFGQVADKIPLRMEPLGRDRHGRIYWFVCRRIFVHDILSDTVRYFSSVPQLYELVIRFDEYRLEKRLFSTIHEKLADIIEQMSITMELTSDRRNELAQMAYERKLLQPPAETLLNMDNLHRISEILADSWNRAIKRTEVNEVEDETQLCVLIERMMGLSNGRLINSFWSMGLEESEVLEYRNNKITADQINSGYRLGFDDQGFKNYENYFNAEMAKTAVIRKKEADKRKYMAGRFSLEDEGKFEWTIPKNGSVYVDSSQMCKYIEDAIIKMTQKLPAELMHRRWIDVTEEWKNLLHSRKTEGLRHCLLMLECGMRKPVFLPQWWNSLGHVRLSRTTIDDRETRAKSETTKKKFERELAAAEYDDEDVIWVKFTKIGGAPKNGIWRLKDEQYRVNGHTTLGGWMWVSRTFQRRYARAPDKPPLRCTDPSIKLESGMENDPPVKKARRLENIVRKLSKWRTDEEAGMGTSGVQTESSEDEEWVCYSPSCRNSFGCPMMVCADNLLSGFMSCYSSECRRRARLANERARSRLSIPIETSFDEDDEKKEIKPSIDAYSIIDASGIVKARDPDVIRRMRRREMEIVQNPTNVAGEDFAFPMPRPFEFISRSTKTKSLLVLPQMYLRRMARQGGLNAAFFIPGFHRAAKANYYVWNYPCPRPLIDLCWRWSTLHARSLHAVALQLRMLHSSIRWADMTTTTQEEEKTKKVLTHLADRDEFRTVIGHKEMPPDGFYEMVMLDGEGDDDDSLNYSGRTPKGRKRKSVNVKKSDMKARGEKKLQERWIDGVELKLWEIILYWQQRNHKLLVETGQRKVAASTTTRKAITSSTPQGSPLLTINRSSNNRDWSRQTRSQVPNPRLPSQPRTNQQQTVVYGSSTRSLGSTQTFSPNQSGHTQTRHRLVKYAIGPDGQRRIISSTIVPAGSSHTVVRSRQNAVENPLDDRYAQGQQLVDFNRKRNIGEGLGSGQSSYATGNSMYESEPDPKKIRVSGQRMTASGMTYQGGLIRGGGRILQGARAVGTPPTSQFIQQTDGTGDTVSQNNQDNTMADEPPVIPRYDTPGGGYASQQTQPARIIRPTQTGQLMYSHPSQSQAQRTAGGKVLMIRRADGTTQYLRPVQKDGVQSVENRAAGGAERRYPPAHQTSSLDDHAGMVQMPARRVISAPSAPMSMRGGRPMRGGVMPTRGGFLRSSVGAGINSLSSLRRQPIVPESDPFMKRMAAEKANSGAPSLTPMYGQNQGYGSSNSSGQSRARSYATYYDKQSNEQIDVDEFQAMAEQGLRPPGRPPVRLANSFGMGNKQGMMQGSRLISRGGAVPRMDQKRFGYHQQPLRKVTSYKEYCARRGIVDGFSRRAPQRPVRFEFESNEEEDRAIAEAIAREEELMRMEEEAKAMESGGKVREDYMRRIEDEFGKREDRPGYYHNQFPGVHNANVNPLRRDLSPGVCRNLLPNVTDSSDTKVIKQVLESMVTQVCRWDKHYGWYRGHLRKPKYKMDTDKFKARKVYLKQSEMMLTEHLDRLRKEINKRRSMLENRAEEEVGMMTPWRKARGRPGKNKLIRRDRDENGDSAKKRVVQGVTTKPAEPAPVVNPAEISLGGEIHDWTKEQKPSGVVRSKIVIKDDDDRVSVKSGRSGRSGRSNSIVLQRRRRNSSMRSNEPPQTNGGWISPRKPKTDSSADEDKPPTSGILMHVPPITPSRGRGRPRKSEVEKKKREELQREQILAEGSASNHTTLDPSQLHCICRTPYDEKKFYVACNVCSRWFHGKCVGISEKKAKRLSSFTCEDCEDRKDSIDVDEKIDIEASTPREGSPQEKIEKVEPEEELYCLCRTPYDDTLFYVGCDGCEGWFHPKCVNITQEEAEMAAQYLCPSCTQNQDQEQDQDNDDNDGYESAASSTNSDVHNALSRADYPLVWSLLETISEHRLAWPFKDPVDTTQFPTYLEVVKHPIDLGIIQNKLHHLEYRRLRDFASDMLIMLDNAKSFNIKGSEIYKCAEELENVFRLNLASVKANIESRNEMDGRRVSESHTVDSSMDIDTDQLIDVDIDPSLFDQFI